MCELVQLHSCFNVINGNEIISYVFQGSLIKTDVITIRYLHINLQ